MNIFKLTWKKIILSLVLLLILGWAIGGYLFFSGSCFSIIWGYIPHCANYSPVKLFFAYVFSWPFLITQTQIGYFGWLVLWIYYYFIASLSIFIYKKLRR
jgi:hypothetical protein